MTVVAENVLLKRLGRVDYQPTLQAMRSFTLERAEDTPDEVWIVEHPPVYTLGQGAKALTVPNGIPVVRADRGGEVTYHGPGQVVLYTLVDLARRGIKVKRFVWLLEQAALDLLEGRGERKAGAPGVYVRGAKIAALGIRVAKGRAYHGLALNVDMDLAPFSSIDPCGFPGLAVTDLKSIGLEKSFDQAATQLARLFVAGLEHA